MAIENQARLAIVTSVLVALALHASLGLDRFNDLKSLRKQDKRQAAPTDQGDGTGRADWTVPVFRYTSEMSHQVLRFFNTAFSSRLHQRSMNANCGPC